jgi:hypothetical protein
MSDHEGAGRVAGGRGKTEVDPEQLDKAARRMRQMAVRDFHAGDAMELGLTQRAGADHVFGNSPAAKDVAAKWDRAVTRRVEGAEDLGTRTQDMAENLERTADDYRRRDDEQRTTYENLDERIG